VRSCPVYNIFPQVGSISFVPGTASFYISSPPTPLFSSDGRVTDKVNLIRRVVFSYSIPQKLLPPPPLVAPEAQDRDIFFHFLFFFRFLLIADRWFRTTWIFHMFVSFARPPVPNFPPLLLVLPVGVQSYQSPYLIFDPLPASGRSFCCSLPTVHVFFFLLMPSLLTSFCVRILRRDD